MAGIMRKTVNFVLLICFLIVEFNSSTAVNSYGDCKSPYNTTGNCIELSECKSLFAILQMGVVSDADRDFLAKSQCGYFDNKVLICCQDPQNLTNLLPNPPKCGRFLEDRIIGGSLTKINEHPWTALVEHTKLNNYGECITPNRERGNCIELNDCKSLYAIIETGVLSETERVFLGKSQCGYNDGKVLICCSDGQSNLLPQSPDCGHVLTNRIIGGKVTGLDEYPWMALIEYTLPDNTKTHSCGGSLINNRYVVTAAHCIVGHSIPRNYRLSGVRLGEWDTTTNPDCERDVITKPDCAPAHQDISVEERIVHPQYNANSANQANDIALLRLARAVAFTSFIKPVCLPIESDIRNDPFTGSAMEVAGWGRTETQAQSPIKLKATVHTWDLNDCKTKYRKQNILLEPSQLCAGGVEGVDSCNGDSGGPLVVQKSISNKNIYFLAGIVSFGPRYCALKDWPGVYTRVGAYVDWIQSTIKA